MSLARLALLIGTSVLLGSCGGGGSTTTAPITAPPPAPPPVATAIYSVPAQESLTTSDIEQMIS